MTADPNTCHNCGAPVARSATETVVCSFCEAANAPLPAEPVKYIQQVVQVARSEDADGTVRRCPHCRRILVAVVAKGVTLHGCGGCGGIWVDNASARSVLQKPEEIFGELSRRAGRNAKSKVGKDTRPQCPECPVILVKVRTYGIELDVCSKHGTWFDAYELDSLVRKLNAKVPATADPTEDRTIQCSDCRTVIAANRANIGPYGLVCEACWRRDEAMIIEAGEQKAYADGAVTVGGVLLGVAGVMLGGMAAADSS